MARKSKKDPTPLQRWAATPEAARTKHPPMPTAQEWRNMVRDFRHLGERYAERRNEIAVLERRLAEAPSKESASTEPIEPDRVPDAGWRHLHDVARAARGAEIGRAVADWLEDWAPAWTRLP